MLISSEAKKNIPLINFNSVDFFGRKPNCDFYIRLIIELIILSGIPYALSISAILYLCTESNAFEKSKQDCSSKILSISTFNDSSDSNYLPSGRSISSKTILVDS